MRTRVRRDEDGGTVSQLAAQAALADGPRCDHTEQKPSGLWECIRPPHGGSRPDVDTWRRRNGKIPHVDKHYLRKAKSS